MRISDWSSDVCSSDLLSQIPSYEGGEYSHYTKRYYSGPSGELLDALIFSKFHLGSVPVSVKLGRHTEYWGESLFLNGAMHSVAYAQSPIDLQKGFAKIGRESCRERGGQYVKIQGVAVTLKKKI